MDGKGKGGPRVEYFDEDIALMQKLTRPKLPPQPTAGPESAPSLQPKQGGAVDAEALRRIRRVSAPNLLAIRMPGDPDAAETAERTLARATPLSGQAFPASEAAPSTIPEEDESTLRQRKRERELAPLVPPDEEPDSETSPGGFSDAMVTKQVPADVARRLLSEVAAMDSAHVRAAMGAGPAAPRDDSFAATLPVGASAPRAPPEIQALRRTAPIAERAAPPPPPPPPAAAEDRRDPAQTLASLPKPSREAPGFSTLPLGSSSGEVGAALRSAEAAVAAGPGAPSAMTSSFGSTHLMPQSMPLPLVTPASHPRAPAPAASGSTPPMPPLGASGAVPSMGASGSVPSMGAMGASGSVPSMGAMGTSGSVPSMVALGGGGITVPPGSGGAMSASEPRPGGITVPPVSSGVASGLPVAAPRKRSRAWLWALLALVLVGLVVGGGVLAKRRNPRMFSMPYKVG